MRKIIVSVLIALCLAVSGWAAAEPAVAPSEYQVKAAVLYNLAKFVEWPNRSFSHPSAPIIIGILGDDPFGNAFEAAKDKLVKGRKVQVQRSGKAVDLLHCQVLFISASERGRLPSLLKEFQGSGTLLVADMDKFALQGGMIGLALRDEMVAIEINIDALQRANIKINERLLNSARIIHDGRSGPTP